jgi:type II secretory pathway component PulF
MPSFAFTGRTRGGQTISGERIADTADAATMALRREQIMVTRISPAKAKPEEKKAKAGRPLEEGQVEEPGGLHAPVFR